MVGHIRRGRECDTDSFQSRQVQGFTSIVIQLNVALTKHGRAHECGIVFPRHPRPWALGQAGRWIDAVVLLENRHRVLNNGVGWGVVFKHRPEINVVAKLLGEGSTRFGFQALEFNPVEKKV
jgi:hypothetical protein